MAEPVDLSKAIRAVQDVLADMPEEYHLGLSSEASARVVRAALRALLADPPYQALEAFDRRRTDQFDPAWAAIIDALTAEPE